MEGDKKITRRIGSFTFGIMMILMGINIFLETITSLDLFRFTLSLWPIVFILLGVETLYYSAKKGIEIKYDVLGIITIFLVLFLGVIFSTINYGVNKVLYNKDVKSDIIYYLTDPDYNLYFSDKISINNNTQSKVRVKFVEDKEASEVTARVVFNYDETYEGSIIRALKERDLLNMAFDIDYDEQKIDVTNVPSFVKDIVITVTANDKSKLVYGGVIE